MDSFVIHSKVREEFLDITDQVRASLQRHQRRTGVGVVYCPHTTAGITINENCDPDVVHDMLGWLRRAIPHGEALYRHGEGNSDSHLKATLVGSSAMVLVEKGELVLGRWQGIFLCEFDGPRTRTVHVQWIGTES